MAYNFVIDYRKALGVQKKVNKELKEMFNQSAIFDVEFLTKVLMVCIYKLKSLKKYSLKKEKIMHLFWF